MAPTTAADIRLHTLNISVCIFCLPEQCLCAFKGYNVLNIAIGLVMSLIPGGQRETLRSESGTRRDGSSGCATKVSTWAANSSGKVTFNFHSEPKIKRPSLIGKVEDMMYVLLRCP